MRNDVFNAGVIFTSIGFTSLRAEEGMGCTCRVFVCLCADDTVWNWCVWKDDDDARTGFQLLLLMVAYKRNHAKDGLRPSRQVELYRRLDRLRTIYDHM